MPYKDKNLVSAICTSFNNGYDLTLGGTEFLNGVVQFLDLSLSFYLISYWSALSDCMIVQTSLAIF